MSVDLSPSPLLHRTPPRFLLPTTPTLQKRGGKIAVLRLWGSSCPSSAVFPGPWVQDCVVDWLVMGTHESVALCMLTSCWFL